MATWIRTREPIDLYALAVLLVLVPVVVFALPGAAVVRVPLGLAFLLVAPGYALVAALFPRRATPAREEAALTGLERAALSLGLSIAVVPLLGLLLNYLPWGIRLVPVVMAVALFTAAMLLIAWRRRLALPPLARLEFSLGADVPRWKELGGVDRALVVACVAALLVAGGTVAYVATAPRPGESFTEFYVLGPDGKAEGYPTELRAGEPATVILGVANHEGAPQSYTITPVLVNVTFTTNDTGATVATDGERRALVGLPVALADEGREEFAWAFEVPDESPRKLVLELRREGDEEPYRTLHLWLNRPGDAP